jgi:hypothetical protein
VFQIFVPGIDPDLLPLLRLLELLLRLGDGLVYPGFVLKERLLAILLGMLDLEKPLFGR